MDTVSSDIKYVTFDCYGTLIDFEIGATTARLLSDQVPDVAMAAFLSDYSNYRYDEVLGDWKPYRDVIINALGRTCRLWSLPFPAEDADKIYAAIPSWGPHADVPEPLARVADAIPLVILSNASDSQIGQNVDRLGAPFHAVLTAEQAGAYKPRLRAFEFMFDQLGCDPSEVMHVSSSLRYDLMSAHDMKIGRRVFVERGHGPGNAAYGYDAITDLSGLPSLLGL